MTPLPPQNGPHAPMDLKPMSAKTLRASTPLRIAGVLVDLFTRVGQREPPEPHKSQHARFISIAVSNYVEKARWGLDLLEANAKSPLYLTEDLHPPALHAFQTVRASKDQASQSPMVVLADGRVLWGSDDILRQICNDEQTVDLYPAEIKKDIMAMEDDLGKGLGASVRCYGYYCLCDKSKKYYGIAAKFLTPHCPKAETFLFSKMLDKGLAKGMLKTMNVTEESGEASEKEIRQVFDDLSKRLEANGGGYLMDTPNKKYGFTAADLTLGALSYLVIRPPEMQPFLTPESELPPRMVQLGKDVRETTAGKHVLKIYKEHRPINKGTGEIEIKKVDQNRIPWVEIAGTTTLLGAISYGVMVLKSPTTI